MILRLMKFDNFLAKQKNSRRKRSPRIFITLKYLAGENNYSTGCYLKRTSVLRKEIFFRGFPKGLFHQPLGRMA
jgi:hypothetical protein